MCLVTLARNRGKGSVNRKKSMLRCSVTRPRKQRPRALPAVACWSWLVTMFVLRVATVWTPRDLCLQSRREKHSPQGQTWM